MYCNFSIYPVGDFTKSKNPLDLPVYRRGSKGLRVQGSETRGLVCECQLRYHHPNAAAGIPTAAVREAIDVHIEAVGVHVHARNEELVTNLEQEECGVAVGAKPFAILLHELDDLGLRQAEQIQIVGQAAEDRAEVSIPDHLMDLDLLLSSRFAFDVAAVGFEVSVNQAPECVIRLGDGFLAVGRIDDEHFRARNELETAGNVLRELSELLLDEGGDRSDEFVAAFEQPLEVLGVNDIRFREFVDRRSGGFAGRVGNYPNDLFFLSWVYLRGCNRWIHRYYLFLFCVPVKGTG